MQGFLLFLNSLCLPPCWAHCDVHGFLVNLHTLVSFSLISGPPSAAYAVQLFARLGMLLAGPDVEVKASVVAAIASFAEASAGCRQRLVATPRWVGW